MARFFISFTVLISILSTPQVVNSGWLDTHDDDFFPYALTGLDAWIFDDASGREVFGGRIDGNYLKRDSMVSKCQSISSSTARAEKLRSWSYICCTVTPTSDCATKVK